MASPSGIDRFWLLVSLKLDNEASVGELQELDQLIRDNPEWLDLLNRAGRISNLKAYPLQPPDAEHSFSRHVQRLSNHLSKPPMLYVTTEPSVGGSFGAEEQAEPARRNTRLLRYSLITGSVAASLILVFLLINNTGKHNAGGSAVNVISTRYGSKSKVQLPDGTQVWLNADSKLTYSKEFGNRAREVSLSGEAFFDVVKDADHPFVIHANGFEIKVLGTAFNVRSYQSEKTAEATLIRGSIEVTLNSSPEHKVLLKPSDRIIVENKPEANSAPAVAREDSANTIYWLGKVDVKEKGNISLETVYKKNSLSFKNETLENVAGRIEHWFNVKVAIDDEELKKVTYSCDFKDESLRQVMEALHLTGRFQYQIASDSVFITK